jgi:hypothetical protein
MIENSKKVLKKTKLVYNATIKNRNQYENVTS